MAIIKAANRKNYTRISNKILNDPTISLKAKGLWTLLMSKPDDWEITIAGTATMTKERPDALKAIFAELVRSGYMRRHVVSQGKGVIKTVSTLYEEVGLSTVRNNPLEEDLSTVPFTSDVNTPEENMGAILTTDEPTPDSIKTEVSMSGATAPTNPPEAGEAANGASSVDGAATDGQETALDASLQAKPNAYTSFSDQATAYELRANDIDYFNAPLRRMFGYRLHGNDASYMQKVVGDFGRQEIMRYIRQRHKEAGTDAMSSGFQFFINGIYDDPTFLRATESVKAATRQTPEQKAGRESYNRLNREATQLLRYYESVTGKRVQRRSGNLAPRHRTSARKMLEQYGGYDPARRLIDAHAVNPVAPIRDFSSFYKKLPRLTGLQ